MGRSHRNRSNSGTRDRSLGHAIAAGRFCFWAIFLLFFVEEADSLGSMSGLAASYTDSGSGAEVCGIVPGSGTISCWESSTSNISEISYGEASFVGVAAGRGFFCGLREWAMVPICFDAPSSSPRRLSSQSYSQIAVGDSHLCGIRVLDGGIDCWRANSSFSISAAANLSFANITSGADFSCGILSSNQSVVCWGQPSSPALQGFQPRESAFSIIQAGGQHVCGLYSAFGIVTYCWGSNSHGQSDAPEGLEFAQFALGRQHSCGLLRETRFAFCWGDNSSSQLHAPSNISFDSIVAGDFYTCGVRSSDLGVICWGGAFAASVRNSDLRDLGMNSLPGSCTTATCPRETFQVTNASGVGGICSSLSQHVCVFCSKCPDGAFETSPCGKNNQDRQCSSPPPPSSSAPAIPPLPQSPPRSRKRGLSNIEIVSIVLGSTGLFLGILSALCCSWARFCKRESPDCRIHHSANANNGSVTISQQQQLRRQRSGASTTFTIRSQSRRSLGRADAFTLDELALATDNFNEDNRIGTGSFGSVYRGVLPDGRQVAIKRGGIGSSNFDALAKKKFQDKEAAYQSELEFLTRLHHRHLVTLVGYCAEGDERLLVYDFMPNGTVHDHLHGKKKTQDHQDEEIEHDPQDEIEELPAVNFNSWQMRIGIALQAARGIEYLHTYAVPPIIHRDIKSSNILLDSDWTARVSDFGLSLMGPSEEESHLSMTAAGTVGYMDPEYYRLQHLTTKSDVYSFGVVLLELLTGKRAIIVENKRKLQENPQLPVNVVDYAVPFILAGQLGSVLDRRPGSSGVDLGSTEMEAVTLVAELAEECVRLEGRERPTMGEIVTRLENAVAILNQGQQKKIQQEEEQQQKQKKKKKLMQVMSRSSSGSSTSVEAISTRD